MDDLLNEFLTETSENLGVLDLELVRLEQNPSEPQLLSNIFRLVHTIKGTCGFLGLGRLEKVAHAGENVLGKFRDGELAVTPDAVSLILEALDAIKCIVAALAETESEPAGDDADLIARLNAMAEGQAAPVAARVGEIVAAPAPAIAHIEDVELAPAMVVAAPEPAAAATSAPPAKDADMATQTIRVHVDLIEDLMTMVSELVLTRNQLMQILRGQKDSQFTTPLQRLSQVTTELQEGVMKTRMQPIGNAWSKLPRLVRDLSHELGKKLELRMIGAETELDRQVLEMIKDPLTHMVRNSGDHGIERPAERAASGKSETGTITLNAYHVGGHIMVEIADDGRGLAVDKIRAKVLAKGLATEADLAGMTDQQIQSFIFKAGFSTADTVTSVSGRGVGMDVVRTNIERIGGTIELRSQAGKGTTFLIKIPLTLAIVSALIVECAGQRFAVPQLSVVELVRAAADSEHRIERIHSAPVLRLRDRLLPLVSLRKVLQVPEQDATSETFVVVSQVGSYTFGIIVDRVFDTEEIVVKPVAPVLRDVPIYGGNTILGDGSVIMILDPNGIAETTGESLGEGGTAATDQARAAAQRHGEQVGLLLFAAGGGAPKAVPLALVARLEELDRSQIEQADGLPVVQYRGKLMPLVTIDGAPIVDGGGRQPVIVFQEGERAVGLAVDAILDIIEDRFTVEMSNKRPGLIGSAVVGGKATDMLDIGTILHGAAGGWFVTDQAPFQAANRNRRLLLVDDSAFFRNLLAPMLAAEGYDVTAVDGPTKALDLARAGAQFDLILSDIEMPDMNGFGFAEAVRRQDAWQGVPIIALSSHCTPDDMERGRRSGFTQHLPKLDRDQLLATLHQTFELRGAA